MPRAKSTGRKLRIDRENRKRFGVFGNRKRIVELSHKIRGQGK